ncbi:helix-turn-helix transcriptional regulator [Intestinibacter sp.]|uniref:helix-turn-helix transcriptional regulator n=1 Tax=Intestinibacter sp. TaxID=1965304 RepID=UPI002A758C3B|nr:helix-turn-helix domain-containing protein [Intestinibacter sp.]MDY2735190.1 helix-turn-helix domain-containing protein [Intestinibacter sp.]
MNIRLVKSPETGKVKFVDPYENQKLITVQEFGKRYGIGKSKAYTLANMKGFPCIRNGNKILVISSKIDEWLEAHIGLEF